MDSKRLNGTLNRDLYVLDDENNPGSSKVHKINPTTILDQVYDDQDPTHKTLREIIADLRQEIITGGKGNIVFPVTTVNGKDGDVQLTAADLGIGRLDNTPDMDKPLSVPQKTAIMELLANYNFNLDLKELYDHIHDTNNPHQTTLDKINLDKDLEKYIETMIGAHNISTNTKTHLDIRRSLSTLWNLVDRIDGTIETRLNTVLDFVEDHIDDMYAHGAVFNTKEDVKNKITSLLKDEDVDHINYPTARSVVEYVMDYAEKFRGTLPNINNWIDDIQVVDSRNDVPTAGSRYYRKAYFIKRGMSSYSEIAICRRNPDDSYSWDYRTLTYSHFNEDHFVDSPDGLSINMHSIVDHILSTTGTLNSTMDNILSNYYTIDDITNMHLIDRINILPGTQDGTIRFYINGNMATMSSDIQVAGLRRLAYLESVSENEIKDNAVRSKHIIDGAVETRHIQDKSITLDKLKFGTYGTLLGNMVHDNTEEIHEIKLSELADLLRPLIGGWPDPNTPGGNPWMDVLVDQLPHPHIMTPKLEYDLQDKSYIMRFTGEISCLPNMNIKTHLTAELPIDTYRIIDAGGSWCYQSDPEEWTILGGSNITGHTFATITMNSTGVYLESISIGDRMNARYDVWVKYIKRAEMKE